MITTIAGWLLPHVGAKLAKPLAWVAVVVAAGLLLLAAKTAYDAAVVDDALSDANVDALERKDAAAGEADVESGERREEHEKRVRTTGELVDEAISKGCAVGEYLASDGANCVRE